MFRRSRSKGKKSSVASSRKASTSERKKFRKAGKRKSDNNDSSPRAVVERSGFEDTSSEDDRYSSGSERSTSSGASEVEPPSLSPNSATPKRENRKGASRQQQDKYSSPDDDKESFHSPNETSNPKTETSKRKNAKDARNQPKSKASSSRREADDDTLDGISSDDGDSTTQSDGSSYSSSSYETTYVGDQGDDLVHMIKEIKHVFSGPSEDSESVGSSKGNSSYGHGSYSKRTDGRKSYNKLCYRLGLNDANLVELTVECDAIVKDMAREMAELMPKNYRLKRLCLVCGGEIRHRQIFRIIMSGLAGNGSISEVEIRGPKGVTKDKSDALVQDTCEPMRLDCESASWLGTALAKNQSVRKIILNECQFVDSGLAVLFLGIQHSKIQELSLKSFNLTESNVDVISASLPLLTLTSLSLVETHLPEESLSFLCDNIKNTPSLAYINLSHNSLGQNGMLILAKSLKGHEKLNELVLSSCSLDDACIDELTKRLKRNSALSTLDVSQNEFGDQGASYLKDLVDVNTSIKDLRVDGCEIKSRKMLNAIASVLRYNNSILKSFGISATASSAIFQSVDTLEEMGGMIGSSVSEVVNM